jgi:hypothetical protein
MPVLEIQGEKKNIYFKNIFVYLVYEFVTYFLCFYSIVFVSIVNPIEENLGNLIFQVLQRVL